MEKGSTFSADSGAILDIGESSKERHFSRSGSGVVSVGTGVVSKKGGDFGDSGLCLLGDTSASSLMAPNVSHPFSTGSAKPLFLLPFQRRMNFDVWCSQTTSKSSYYWRISHLFVPPVSHHNPVTSN